MEKGLPLDVSGMPPPKWVMLDDVAAMRRIGVRVKTLRRKMGWRQVDAAKNAGVSPQTYKTLESTGRCNLTTLLKVARAFGVFGTLAIFEEGEDS